MFILPYIPDHFEPLGHVYAHQGIYLQGSMTLHNLFILSNETREAQEAQHEFEHVRLALYHQMTNQANKLGANCISGFSFTIQKLDSYYLVLQAQGICGILTPSWDIPTFTPPKLTSKSPVTDLPDLSSEPLDGVSIQNCPNLNTQDYKRANHHYPDVGLEHQLEYLDRHHSPDGNQPKPPVPSSENDMLSIKRVNRHEMRGSS